MKSDFRQTHFLNNLFKSVVANIIRISNRSICQFGGLVLNVTGDIWVGTCIDNYYMKVGHVFKIDDIEYCICDIKKIGDRECAYDAINEISFGEMYHGITYPDEAYNDMTRNKITINF